MDLLGVPSFVVTLVFYVLLAVKVFAFVNSLLWSAEHYRAAEKWTKPGWVIVLGIAVALQEVAGIPMIVNLGLTVAAFVYLADVRPAMASLRRR
ncbi:MAG: DUF2516 family protein [Nocardioidaceae bacterium]